MRGGWGVRPPHRSPMRPSTRTAHLIRAALVFGLLTVGGCTSRPEPDPVPAPPDPPGTPPPIRYGVGDAIEVNWDGTWHPARIVEIYDNRYRVAYDGAATDLDPWATLSQIRHAR